ncbi:MAG: hypothetical protein ABW022_00110 [Actinoplanes sp.]
MENDRTVTSRYSPSAEHTDLPPTAHVDADTATTAASRLSADVGYRRLNNGVVSNHVATQAPALTPTA